ncbi:MAG: hypothetical protein CMI09_08540 [Oceanospirillaceae bacterium]|nr:hypothetical protein [Oceanospirillaceae bacterium]
MDRLLLNKIFKKSLRASLIFLYAPVISNFWVFSAVPWTCLKNRRNKKKRLNNQIYFDRLLIKGILAAQSLIKKSLSYRD